MNNNSQPSLPSENTLLGAIFFLSVGALVAATGTYSQLGVGRWSGPHVRIGGLGISALGAYGIFLHLRPFWPQVRLHSFLYVLFLCSAIVSAGLPFLDVFHTLHLALIFWLPIPLFLGHLLHKNLVQSGSTTDDNK